MCMTERLIWSDLMCIYCKMITTISLVNIHNVSLLGSAHQKVVPILFFFFFTQCGSSFSCSVTRQGLDSMTGVWEMMLCWFLSVCMCVQLLSCVQPCDPMDCSWPGSFIHGILQARILEWVAMSSSRGFCPLRDRTHVTCIAGRFFTTSAT